MKILFPSIVVIALLQSIHFVHCQLTMKMSVRETNRKLHFAIDDEVCEEIMNYLRSKLMLKCRYIMSNDKKNIPDPKKRDI